LSGNDINKFNLENLITKEDLIKSEAIWRGLRRRAVNACFYVFWCLNFAKKLINIEAQYFDPQDTSIWSLYVVHDIIMSCTIFLICCCDLIYEYNIAMYLLYGEMLYSYIEYPMRRPLICKYSVCYTRHIFFLSVFASARAAVNNSRYRCSYSSRPFLSIAVSDTVPLASKILS